MTCESSSNFRDEILHGMAKAFFCSAYADYATEHPEDDSLDKPGPGGDWMDCLPDLPSNAWALAGELWSGLEHANERSMYQISVEIEAACPLPDWNEFGHYLAMEAMGSGVGWGDSHPDHGLQIPSMECSEGTFDSSAYGQASDFPDWVDEAELPGVLFSRARNDLQEARKNLIECRRTGTLSGKWPDGVNRQRIQELIAALDVVIRQAQ